MNNDFKGTFLGNKMKKITFKSNLNTGIPKLDDFMSSIRFDDGLTEWGAARGKFSRLMPSVIAASINEPCLWLLDLESAEEVYPQAFSDAGFSLDKIHFLKTKDPFEALKVALRDDVFKLIIFDSQTFLNKGDLSFISNLSRKNKSKIFLIRHFFLTNKNGNPFTPNRFNTSFDLRSGRFNINTVKGRADSKLFLKLEEVFVG